MISRGEDFKKQMSRLAGGSWNKEGYFGVRIRAWHDKEQEGINSSVNKRFKDKGKKWRGISL